MKILLISPPNTSTYRTYSLMPLGLSYVAASLRGEHEVRLLDYNVFPYRDSRLVKAVRAFAPEVAGITAATPVFNLAVRMAERIKAAAPGCRVVVGGPHVTSLPEPSLAPPAIDYLVLGEGEITMPRLCRALASGEPARGLAGTGWRDEAGVHTLAPEGPLEDLDALRFPAWDLLPMDRYRSKFRACASIITSRGCPFRCSYCVAHLVHGKKVRRRSVENAIAEMRILYDRYRVRYFYFLDDTFTVDRDYSLRLAEAIIRERFALAYWCYTRADRIDPELLALMQRSGCDTVGIGFESGSQRVLDAAGKGVTVEANLAAARMIKASGMFLEGYFIVNYPGETEAELQATEDLIKAAAPTIYDVNFVTPYPRTRLEQECEEQGLLMPRLPGDFRDFWFTDNANIVNPGLDLEAVQAMINRMRRRMFLSLDFWRLLGHHLRRGELDFASLRHFARAVYNLIMRQVEKAGRRLAQGKVD